MSGDTPMIEVNELSKKYRLGQIGAGSLREAVGGWWDRVRGKFGESPEKLANEFWALRDVSFEVAPGEVLGVVGRNGAGKSTLLKLLSRITEPTAGEAILRGRVASLLEVGTGFHPELTGRDNVYLSGAVMGMTRREVRDRFDEIVEFAGLARFIDTPVKRYSSGMYVRLGFAVAAHLTAEILIIDEVLAVGDAAFHQKCFGKMNDVAASGRTVLVVSHQMGMITRLCKRAILLEAGRVRACGSATEVVEQYCRGDSGESSEVSWDVNPGKGAQFLRATLDTGDGASVTRPHNLPLRFQLKYTVRTTASDMMLGMSICDQYDRVVFTTSTPAGGRGDWTAIVTVPPHILTPGRYSLAIGLHVPRVQTLDLVRPAMSFAIVDAGSEFSQYEGADYGCVFVTCDWQVQRA